MNRKLVGYIWSLPYGLVGGLAFVLFAFAGWVDVWRWQDGALEVICRGPLARLMTRKKWAAFTLGWTILFWQLPTVSIARHEHRHVDQALAFGIFYPLFYLVMWASWGYQAHPFEEDARLHEEEKACL